MVTNALGTQNDPKAYIIPLILNNQTISLLLCYKFKDIKPEDIPFKDFDTVAEKNELCLPDPVLKREDPCPRTAKQISLCRWSNSGSTCNSSFVWTALPY